MVTTGSPNPVQNNSKTIVALSILSMQHPLPLSWEGASTLRLPSSNHLIKKNTCFHLNSWSARISKFHCTGKKSRAIFDLVNSGLSLHWLSLNVRGGECILVKKQCEFLIFHQFSHKIVTKHSTFFMSSFPMQLKTCNNQPKKRGMSRLKVESSYFVVFQLLTEKIGFQRK